MITAQDIIESATHTAKANGEDHTNAEVLWSFIDVLYDAICEGVEAVCSVDDIVDAMSIQFAEAV